MTLLGQRIRMRFTLFAMPNPKCTRGSLEHAEQQAVYENRRRVRGEYGKSLLRRRGELIERTQIILPISSTA